MKFSNSSKIMMFCLVVTLSCIGFAADTHKANFQISEAVQVNGTELAAGDYVATWAGNGPDVQVNITRNGRSVATVPAKMIQLDQKSSEDATETRTAGNGRELSTLQFAGKKFSLEIGSGGSSTASVK